MSKFEWRDQLRILIHQQRISMAEVARRADLPPSTLKHMIVGTGRLPVDRLERVLAVLGYELDAHPTEEPAMAVKTASTAAKLTARKLLLANLTKDDQRDVARIAKVEAQIAALEKKEA